jgi:predicted MFS family arabinose efflux permease
VVLVQRHFRERLGLALGIAGSGIGLGIFLVVPLVQVVIEGYGWRWAFRVLAVLSVTWIVPAAWLVLRDTTPSAGTRAVAAARNGVARDLALRAALLTAPFWLIAGAKFLGNVASQALLVHQAAYLVDHGIAPMAAASAISVVGLASIFGKTGGGWLSDRIEREVVYVIGMVFVIASIVMLALVGVLPAWSAYVYAVLIGLGYSVTASLVPAIFSDRFRGAHFGAIFGAGQVGSALGSALGAWLAGRLFDATGSYAIALAVAAAMAAAAAAAIWRARALRLSEARSGS